MSARIERARAVRRIGDAPTDLVPGDDLDHRVHEEIYWKGYGRGERVPSYSRNARCIRRLLSAMLGYGENEVTIRFERDTEQSVMKYTVMNSGYEWDSHNGRCEQNGEWQAWGSAETIHLALCFALLHVSDDADD